MRGAAATTRGSGAARVSRTRSAKTAPSEAKTHGQGTHSEAKMASAPETSMPMRYHMMRRPLAGPTSSFSSTSTV